MKLATEFKTKIVTEARAWVASLWPMLPAGASCLYATLGVIVAAKREGIELLPQGGSVWWRAVSEELDDGLCATHASYEWDPHHPMSQMAIAQGWLPEMHCWAADPMREEIIDITTGAQMERFKTQLEWTAAPLPDYLWGKPQRGWVYEPTKPACVTAIRAMSEVLRGLT